jgi:hypothetical protein
MNQTDHENRNANLEKRAETLRQYVSDMLATEKHIREVVERQRADERVKLQAEAQQLINRIGMTLQQHVEALEQQMAALQGSSPFVKAAVTSALGMAAGLYDKVRTQAVSRLLRDDYTALSLAAMSYTMLYTTSQALYDAPTASLALRHLKDLTPLILEISRLMPQVVTTELAAEHPNLNLASATESLRQTQAAWTSPLA